MKINPEPGYNRNQALIDTLGFDEMTHVLAKGSQVDSPGLDGSDAGPYLPDVVNDDTGEA